MFEIFIIVPSSVKSFVRNIKGKSPGRTEKIKSFKPSIVPEVYLDGLVIIISIIIIIKNENKISSKVSFFKLDIFKLLSRWLFFVVIILSYMLIYWCKLRRVYYDWRI